MCLPRQPSWAEANSPEVANSGRRVSTISSGLLERVRESNPPELWAFGFNRAFGSVYSVPKNFGFQKLTTDRLVCRTKTDQGLVELQNFLQNDPIARFVII
jgi:hypothetical protein